MALPTRWPWVYIFRDITNDFSNSLYDEQILQWSNVKYSNTHTMKRYYGTTCHWLYSLSLKLYVTPPMTTEVHPCQEWWIWLPYCVSEMSRKIVKLNHCSTQFFCHMVSRSVTQIVLVMQIWMKSTEVPNPRRSSACDCTCCHAHFVLFLPMQSLLTSSWCSFTGLVQLIFSFPNWFHTVWFYCSHAFHSFLSQNTLGFSFGLKDMITVFTCLPSHRYSSCTLLPYLLPMANNRTHNKCLSQ